MVFCHFFRNFATVTGKIHETMKITLLKPKGMKETMSRVELHKAVKDIASGTYVDEVHRLRELYPLVHPKKDAEGRIMSNYKLKLALPRLCTGL